MYCVVLLFVIRYYFCGAKVQKKMHMRKKNNSNVEILFTQLKKWLQYTGKVLDANGVVSRWYRSGFEKELYLKRKNADKKID